ncbi:hypothetical protein XELAEV_18003414mg [Xenopus laevis]|nr:hypothetical protein XELAEV_18003414mg [Xenopus laevis]
MGESESVTKLNQFLRILGILCLFLQHQTGAALEVFAPSPQISAKGSNILIQCTFHVRTLPANPKFLTIKWDLYGRRILTYDNGVSTTDPRFSLNLYTASLGEASLSVSNTQVSDGGRYTCTVTYGTEQQETQIILEIQAPPQITITNKVVSENKESVLRASITGFYPQDLDVKWLRDGEILPGVTVNKSQRDPDGTHSTTSTVTIVPTKENRNQIFSVRVQHFSLTVPLQEDFQLIYGVAPSIHIIHEPFYVNKEQTLMCRVWGYYPESIAVSWLVNGSHVEASEIKRINSSALESSYQFLPTAESQGMEISCVVEHQALTQPLVETLKVQLTDTKGFPPLAVFAFLWFVFFVAFLLYQIYKIMKKKAQQQNNGQDSAFRVQATWEHGSMGDPESREVSVAGRCWESIFLFGQKHLAIVTWNSLCDKTDRPIVTMSVFFFEENNVPNLQVGFTDLPFSATLKVAKRVKTVIHVEIPFDKLTCIRSKLLFTLLGCFSQSVNGDCGGRAIPENVNLHSKVDDLIIDIIAAIPSESEEVSVIFTDDETMEHLLNVGHNGNWLLSKAEWDS